MEKAGGGASLVGAHQGRGLLPAAVHDVGAAPGEGAAAGWIRHRSARLVRNVRDLSGLRSLRALVPAPAAPRVRQRDGAHEQLRVGVLRRLDDLLHGAHLDHRPLVHDQDGAAQLVRRGQVVGDVDEADAALPVDAEEGLQDGGAQGGVDHGDGLVGDDHLGVEEQGPGHHDALALAAAELVGVAAQGFLRAQAHSLQALLDPLPALVARQLREEPGHRHRQGVVHPVEGVEDLEGVLEDGLNLAPEGPSRGGVQLAQLRAPVADRAGGWRQDAQQQASQGRLAAAALAGDGHDHRLLLGDHQGGPRHGDGPPPVEEAAAEGPAGLARFEQGRAHGADACR